MRLRSLLRRIAALACACAALARADAPPADSWSALVKWQQPNGFEVTPIHIGLLPNGRLFFVNEYNYMQHPEVDLNNRSINVEFMFTMDTTPAFAATPASVAIQPMANPAPYGPAWSGSTLKVKTLVCSGHALMADGNLLFASGSEATIDLARYAQHDLFGALTVTGVAETMIYHPATDTLTVGASTVVNAPATQRPLRWYATLTRLADKRMLLTGGYDKVSPTMTPNTSVEIYDPAANAWSAVSQPANTPQGIENPDYPHVFQYPYRGTDGSNTVEIIGGSGEAIFLALSPGGASWLRTGKYRPGAIEFINASFPNTVFPNHGASSVLLPLRLPEAGWGYGNGSVLYAGGEYATELMGHIDVYDPARNAWRPSQRMHGLRHDPATILLPDGRVLILGGHDDMSFVKLTGYAEYVDPKNNFSVTQGTANMPETRAYHGLALLLPDGRVVLGGGNVNGDDQIEHQDFRYYYPDYMTKARPQLAVSPATLALGGLGMIAVAHGTPVAEAALMGLGSMTHEFDMNQRLVQLRIFDAHRTMASQGGSLVPIDASQCGASCVDVYYVQAPASAELAPPGDYMLFVLDAGRVPSEGRMVKVQ
jgi:galactose oxidase-like protein